METTAIEIKNLNKTFKIPIKSNKNKFLNYFNPSYSEIAAVNNLSLSVKQGEKIAFIGPNGAGKSTAIKMMTGILHPTSGEISVLGNTPWKNRQKLGYDMGVVFGQKSQLWFHLPAIDTFNLLATIYDLPASTYKKRLNELVELFELNSILNQTVSKMSLGQRMRCELVASLLHKPKILFLDEPSIGLDVTAKTVIRDLIFNRAKEEGTTIFLTSHDTGDMEKICDRVAIINHGSLILDCSLDKLRTDFITKKIITLAMEQEQIAMNLPHVTILSSNPHKLKIEVDIKKTSVEKVISTALKLTELRDITVEDLAMEEVISTIYAKSANHA